MTNDKLAVICYVTQLICPMVEWVQCLTAIQRDAMLKIRHESRLAAVLAFRCQHGNRTIRRHGASPPAFRRHGYSSYVGFDSRRLRTASSNPNLRYQKTRQNPESENFKSVVWSQVWQEYSTSMMLFGYHFLPWVKVEKVSSTHSMTLKIIGE